MYTARSQPEIRTYTRYRYGVPDKPKTPIRSFRMEYDDWAAFSAAVEAAGEDASATLRALANWYARKPKALKPKLPERVSDEQIEDWKRRHPPRRGRTEADPPSSAE
jgi:hypothetical protein